MRSIRRVFNTPKMPPIQQIRGLIQSTLSENIDPFITKTDDGVFQKGIKFKSPIKMIFFDKDDISPECSIFRFAIPTADKPLGFLPGQRISLSLESDDVPQTFYPISHPKDPGIFDILVNVYSRQATDVAQAKFIQKLVSFKEGDKLYLTQVDGMVEYRGRGEFAQVISENGEEVVKRTKKVGMI
jgi:hypothetical protein